MLGAVDPFTLTTQRLVLRPFRSGDVDDVFAYARDDEFGRYLPIPHPYERHHAEEFVAMAAETDWSRHPHLAIVLDNRVIGGTNIRVDGEETAGLGFAIGRDWQRREFATEAAQAMIDCAFATYGVAVVWATADARNVASRRVLEKVGMRPDGVLRQRRVHRGQRVDECHYSVLRAEWETSV